jgi:hypothetical protein
MVYMLTFTINITSIYPSHVSIYTSTMDPMGNVMNIYIYLSAEAAVRGFVRGIFQQCTWPSRGWSPVVPAVFL